ncbi:hypothetical protein BsWGS_09014 [Bradybaena similaris]
MSYLIPFSFVKTQSPSQRNEPGLLGSWKKREAKDNTSQNLYTSILVAVYQDSGVGSVPSRGRNLVFSASSSHSWKCHPASGRSFQYPAAIIRKVSSSQWQVFPLSSSHS